uniref:uncharacterized protein LOC105351422 isoform X2 n=1 Tax=Fragaria vesca subsp. vesca TaxID=101020 RepID=UPI0005CA7AB6|nr:PREDICTED: uncharacterized protein LOC105351422 isoform X2 [Fragaria vesca subsp. vesca]
MEFKRVSLVVMMILLITGTAMAADDCLLNCLTKVCNIAIEISCSEVCRIRCPSELVVDENSKGHNRHHQYCIGCLHHCEKYRDDKKKMGKCIHHCETHCNIKAPSPSLGPISSPSDLSPSPSPSFE